MSIMISTETIQREQSASVEPLDETAGYETDRWYSRLLALPILYKVLFANSAIVMLGALAGTWATIETVRRAPDGAFYELAILFAIAGIVLSVVANFLVLRAAFQPLAVLEKAALAVKNGDFSARVVEVTFTDPQVAHLAETFNATLDELERDRTESRSLCISSCACTGRRTEAHFSRAP